MPFSQAYCLNYHFIKYQLMSINPMLIEERQADLGDFLVGRLLPFRQKRQVGPFTFIDHMGPVTLAPGRYFDVDQHPHIGLSTLTYLFEGHIEHRDSLGTVQEVGPGDVGFMTAGKGVTHTERTPARLRTNQEAMSLHGYQIWVALPKELEEMEPRFDFYPQSELPQWQEGQVQMRLVAGEAFGRKSPLQAYSPLYMLDIRADESANLDLSGALRGELALVIVKGSVQNGEHQVEAGKMLISKVADFCKLRLARNTVLLVFGGEALAEEPRLMWNFVSASKERLLQAKEDWAAGRFPKVPGDDTYVAFP
jgi:hypothetical protein